jgi:hypothetical protein
MKTDFKILNNTSLLMLEDSITDLLNAGYVLIDSIEYVTGLYVQKMRKDDWRWDEECACSSMEMRKICLAFDDCMIRVMSKKK